MIIKGYKNFNSDRLLESLVLESNVYFSDKFLKILGEIQSDIATEIIQMQGNDFKTDSNYIDIDDEKNDTVSFSPDKKAQELVKNKKAKITGNGFYLSTANSHFFRKFDFPNPDIKQEPISSGTIVDIKEEIPSTKTPGKILCYVVNPLDGHKAIINKNSLEVVGERDVWTKNRNNIKIGRLIKKLLTIKGYNCTDKDIEAFVNMWKAQYEIYNDVFRNFDLVRGEDIRKWYYQDSYIERRGTLGNSCMQYDTCQDYFDCYCYNSNVGMLIQRSDSDYDKISGRAIIWTLDDGMVFMDRVYTVNDSDVELFKMYAKQKGWAYKYGQNSMESESIIYKDETIELPKLSITLKGSYNSYPYMDTMKWMNEGTHVMSNFRTSGSKGPLNDTEGNNDSECSYCGGDSEVTCPECDGNCEVTCRSCDGDGKVDCSKCEGSGEMDCPECESGLSECETCGGSGEDSEGNECSDCEGKGSTICSNCEGSGEKPCDKCDGDTTETCSSCNGSGDSECGNCDGRGHVDCPDCS
jgi:hypothetical protein